MKKKTIVKVSEKPPVMNEKHLTAQLTEDGKILILNGYDKKKLIGRYLMDVETHEHCYLEADSGTFREGKLISMMGYNHYWGESDFRKEVHMTEEDLSVVRSALCIRTRNDRKTEFRDVASEVEICESNYSRQKRWDKEERRIMRLRQLWASLPQIPHDFNEYVRKQAAGDTHYAFFDKEKREWTCTACLEKIPEKELVTKEGKKATHNKLTVCPKCKRILQAKTRTREVAIRTHGMLLQNVDEKGSIARHFDFIITWDRRGVYVARSESIRMLLFRPKFEPRKCIRIYYNQGGWGDGFFDRGNRMNCRTYEAYLYPKGIEEALEGTIYKGWTRLFGEMAEKGQLLQYNRCMATGSRESLIGMMEYLFKGGFHRLLRESAENMDYFAGDYIGPLKPKGKTIEEVFGIADRQKINRIRDKDGGNNAVEWMRWSERNRKKIPDEALNWLIRENVKPNNLSFIKLQMNPVQIMNYVKRQQEESYKNKTAGTVLNQWGDYIRMCMKEKKNLHDPMIYRPKELKRRHDELVEEIRKKEMIAQMKMDEERRRKQAEEMKQKYPGAEEILSEIKDRYEYANGEYLIKVPERLVDIMQEGYALHHCAGATDRYFERIRNRETYICFLRKVSEPEIPFYTIEVEPGGTIRQHRSYYDEEPGIEEIRGFLKEWQRVLKKRLTEEDKKLAAVSAVKRLENIEELRQKNNIRVLKGLEQDFMEAM